MTYRISATALARQLGDILGRIRYRGDSFVIERHEAPVAYLGPAPGARTVTAREALAAWVRAAAVDDGFADDLARVGAADRAPRNPWGS